jgi:hypothetical protein
LTFIALFIAVFASALGAFGGVEAKWLELLVNVIGVKEHRTLWTVSLFIAIWVLSFLAGGYVYTKLVLKYPVGRLQYYVSMSQIVWLHMGITTSSVDYMVFLRNRLMDPHFHGIEIAVQRLFEFHLYLPARRRWPGKFADTPDSVREPFGFLELDNRLWQVVISQAHYDINY